MTRSSEAARRPSRQRKRKAPQPEEAITVFVRVLERLEAGVGRMAARSAPPTEATS